MQQALRPAAAGRHGYRQSSFAVAHFPYYYATRFKYDTNAYVYGGYSSGGGGFWDGVNNVSGVLDVFTGVPEDQGVATTIYPNPTFGELTLELPAAATLLLTSAMGQVMLQKEIPAGTRVIDISSFAKGVYHLQIITGKHTGHHTIIKR